MAAFVTLADRLGATIALVVMVGATVIGFVWFVVVWWRNNPSP